jgi:hypothetical protein
MKKRKAALFSALVIIGGFLFFYVLINTTFKNWGATRQEVRMQMPGDLIVEQPDRVHTRAITIHATKEEIYPWLLQMGQNRGGFYSYQTIENLFGRKVRNADVIIPEFQDMKRGDTLRFGPDNRYPWLVVDSVIPKRAVVYTSPASNPIEYSWAFYLVPVDMEFTRLVVRTRSKSSGPFNYIYEKLVRETTQFVMEQKMLRGIRKRAEQQHETAVQ